MNNTWSRIWPSDLRTFQANANAIPMAPGEFEFLCQNCGGHRVMMVFVIENGPFQTPSRKGDKWMDLSLLNLGSGWFHGRLEVSPCPVCCNGQLDTYLAHNCGLEGQDLLVTLSGFKTYGLNAQKQPARNVVENLFSQNKDVAGFVLFHGGFGVGKSHLLKSVVNGFRAIGVLSKYATMPDLLNEIKEKFSGNNGGISAQAVIENYRKAQVLCIDEIDKVSYTSWTHETIFRLLDSRYNEREKLLTVLASNDSPANYPPELGYLASRFSGGVVMHVPGPDLRPAEGYKASQQFTHAAAIAAAQEQKELLNQEVEF
ncbi:MAG: hypothetical protein CVU46_17215 [Chloroflexi bacterium HGW-Chloroflexi-8]|nr:MAG: hypothetical protein CVU46_17215 [Chloroflexi bacterium HGW-Chloroflexi-8]